MQLNSDIMLVARENIPTVWQGLREKVVAATEEASVGELHEDFMFQSLLGGTYQLWLYIDNMKVDAWVITSISDYGPLRRLRFVLLGGEKLDKWLEHIDAIEQWAVKLGCTEAESWVRPGLRKKLRVFGYKKKYEVLVKEITNKALS